jgi:uncharacterized membrane protein
MVGFKDMLRVLIYSLTGTCAGIVMGFFSALFANVSLLDVMIVGSIGGVVGCICGRALASQFNRKNILQRPFLVEGDVNLLSYVAYTILIPFLPLQLTNRWVSKIKEFLGRQI